MMSENSESVLVLGTSPQSAQISTAVMSVSTGIKIIARIYIVAFLLTFLADFHKILLINEEFLV